MEEWNDGRMEEWNYFTIFFMKDALKKSLFFFSILLIITSCGTTQVVVPNYAQAEIYQNSKYIGKGSANIPKRGFIEKSKFSARHNGREIGSVVIKRHFDLVSLYFTAVTYGTGFFFTWKYPETIIIPTENQQEQPVKSPWD